MTAAPTPTTPPKTARRGRSGYAKAGATCRNIVLTPKGEAAADRMERNAIRRAFRLPPLTEGEE